MSYSKINISLLNAIWINKNEYKESLNIKKSYKHKSTIDYVYVNGGCTMTNELLIMISESLSSSRNMAAPLKKRLPIISQQLKGDQSNSMNIYVVGILKLFWNRRLYGNELSLAALRQVFTDTPGSDSRGKRLD